MIEQYLDTLSTNVTNSKYDLYVPQLRNSWKTSP